MKAQFFTDFLTELPPVVEEKTFWLLSVDGSSNKKGSRVGVILEGPGDIVVEQSIRFRFETSNNHSCSTLAACHLSLSLLHTILGTSQLL